MEAPPASQRPPSLAPAPQAREAAPPQPPQPKAESEQPKRAQPNTPYQFQFQQRPPLPPQQPPKPAPTFKTPQFRSQQDQKGPVIKQSGRLKLYIQSIGAKHHGLEAALKKEGIKESVYDFVKRMLIFSVFFAFAIASEMSPVRRCM